VTTNALPTDPQERKDIPIFSGVLDYFPAAIMEVAKVSKAGNDQHNPGEPLHWARGKSMDHADCVARHLVDRGKLDADGQRHTAKAAWRVLALLQEELEASAGAPVPRGAWPAEDDKSFEVPAVPLGEATSDFRAGWKCTGCGSTSPLSSYSNEELEQILKWNPYATIWCNNSNCFKRMVRP
jgi:hypothetical protein